MPGRKKLKKGERQARIPGELRASPAIRISAPAGDFGVSTETIRRDLDVRLWQTRARPEFTAGPDMA